MDGVFWQGCGEGAGGWEARGATPARPSRVDRQQIRQTFLPERSIIHRSYATEAAHALGKRALVPEHTAAFELLPVPGGETLQAWVERFVVRGESIESLLRARANHAAATVTDTTRREAAKLRAETIALLGRLRTALADELTDTPDVLVRLEAELFGYLDQLAAAREEANRRRSSHGSETSPEAEIEDEAIEPATVELMAGE